MTFVGEKMWGNFFSNENNSEFRLVKMMIRMKDDGFAENLSRLFWVQYHTTPRFLAVVSGTILKTPLKWNCTNCVYHEKTLCFKIVF